MAETNGLQVIRASLQDDREEDMQPNLWSRLPMELVAIIITYATDPAVQDAWCGATEHSRHLHEIAMETRWHSIVMDDRDLQPHPGDDRMRFYKIQKEFKAKGVSHDWNPAGEMLDLLISTNESGRCPANYVRHITFDFRMLRYWTNEVLDNQEDAHDMMPSLKSAEFTLDQLKECLYYLKRVTCHGDAPQVVLDFITRHATAAQEIELRSLKAFGELWIYWRDRPARAIYPVGSPLKLQSLSALEQLVRLKIHQLSCHETEGLRSALLKLVNLESLELACAKDEHSSWVGCAFESLLCSSVPAEQNELTHWLPKGLKHLSMIETYYTFWEPSLPAPQQNLAFPERLEYLSMYFAYKYLVSFVLDQINMASLRFLAIPEYCTRRGEALSYSTFDGIVQQSRPQLASIRLLNAWDFDINQLTNMPSFNTDYVLEDVVLGTRDPPYYYGFIDHWRRHVPNPTLSDYLHGFSSRGMRERIGGWGRTITRLRIDHIDLTPALDVSILSAEFWQNIKILMLQPGSRRLTGDTRCNDTKFIVDRDICDELAQHISSAARCLRVIVISTQWYWIHRDTNTDSSHYGLWSWATAKSDTYQNSLMAVSLNRADMDFLENEDVPYWHERDLIEWHRNLASHAATNPHSPTPDMLRHWNYLTMHRIQEA